jgi:hypothetical protein
MTIVLDTTVIVDILRRHAPALRFAEHLDEDVICSEITRVEVMRGLRSPERAPSEEFFGTVIWAPLDERVARRAGAIGREWRRTHPGIGVADLVVAATALEIGARLATANVKHFPMFKGLRPPY